MTRRQRSPEWSSGLSTTLSLVLGVACPANDPAFPAEVRFSRCARVVKGPTCELADDGIVRLWVASSTLPLDPSGETKRREPRDEGTLLDVVVPPRATELLVRTPGKRPFRLAVRWPTKVPQLEQALELKRQGKLAEARAVLEALPEAPEHTPRKRSQLARLFLVEGRSDEAIALLRETMADHERAGDASEALLDGEALAWALLQQGGHFTEARAALAHLDDEALVTSEGAALLTYYRALVFSESGDVRSALSALRIAEVQARRLDALELSSSIEQMMALQLDALGRHDDAWLRLEGLRQRTTEPCQRASLLTNLGWTSLRAGRTPAKARAALEEAATLFATSCPRPSEEANAHTNLALAASLEGDVDRLEQSLAKSRALVADDPRLELWRIELDAQALLARQKLQPALATYQRLAQLADAAFVPEASWRAAVGEARVSSALQKPDAALEAYRRAEALLDEEYRRLPLGEGLHTLLSDRERATGELLELLVSRGRVEEAFARARHARTRALRQLATAERVSGLEPARRERWERAVASYTAARTELDRASRLDWQLPADKLTAAKAARAREEQAMTSALDDALAELGDAEGTLRAVEADELMVLIAPGRRDWLLFAATAKQVSARPLKLGPEATPAVLAEALLGPIAKELATVDELSWLPWGPWQSVDPRTLTIDGQPLGAAKRVSWRVDVPRKRVRASSPSGALLVADPTRNLPGARLEAKKVRPLLEEPVTVLEGAAATAVHVREAMSHRALLHYAGHARLAGIGGFESELTLADGRLTAAEILTAAEPPPPLVVLSGCETGKTSELGVDALGLAQAFVLAGSDEVIATPAPLDDRAAAEAMTCLHTARANATRSTSEAMRAALAEPGCEALGHYRLHHP